MSYQNSSTGFAEVNPSLNYNKYVSFDPQANSSMQLKNFANSPMASGNNIRRTKKSGKIGRIGHNDKPNYYDFNETSDVPNNFDDYYCGGNSSLNLRSLGLNNTSVSELYFSPKNIARLQKKIRESFYIQTNGQYRLDVDLDEQELMINMRAVFIENSRNLDTHIIKQVKELNIATIDYVLPDIITNAKQYYGYIKDINEPLKPLPQPLNVNRAGRKTLPALTSVWGF